jgi:hypothetical protein
MRALLSAWLVPGDMWKMMVHSQTFPSEVKQTQVIWNSAEHCTVSEKFLKALRTIKDFLRPSRHLYKGEYSESRVFVAEVPSGELSELRSRQQLQDDSERV